MRHTPSKPGEGASYVVHNSVPRWFVPEKPKPLASALARTNFHSDNTTRLFGSLNGQDQVFPLEYRSFLRSYATYKKVWFDPYHYFMVSV